VITGASGSIKDVVNNYKNGKFNEINNPSVSSHFGMDDVGRGFVRGGNL
jgi:hypothetical protein